MTNAELIKALRYCAEHEGCAYYIAKDCPREDTWVCGVDCEQILMLAAADALEALIKLVDLNTERCEALRKQLREAHESYEKHINELTTKCNQLQAEVDNYEKRIAELEAQIPKGGEWISVEDRLPEDLGCVLTANKCGDCTTLWWNDRGWWDNESGYYCCRDYIKYWMELPEPPNCGARMKGENDEQTDC